MSLFPVLGFTNELAAMIRSPFLIIVMVGISRVESELLLLQLMLWEELDYPRWMTRTAISFLNLERWLVLKVRTAQKLLVQNSKLVLCPAETTQQESVAI